MGYISEEQMILYVKAKLGSIKTPKSIDVVEQLPKSAMEKVLKAEIRKQYWSGADRAVN